MSIASEMLPRACGAVFLVLICSGISLGAHPLITDDTATQGKGKFQVELNYEFDHENTLGLAEKLHRMQSTLTYGIIDRVDFVVNLPYQLITCEKAGTKTTEHGIADITVQLKWRYFGQEGLSLAVKPGLSLPTGDDEKGLGAGKVGGSIFFIATQVIEPWTFHFNAGYGREENTLDEDADTWHVSLATEIEVCQWLKVVANLGTERNTDKREDTPAAFILGGLIIPVTENFDLDFGIKGGLTEPESDYAFLAGLTFRL